MSETKSIRVTFSNGERYDIPAELIAESRADYYATEFGGEEATYDKIYEKEYKYTLGDRIELIDWVSNNMEWEDVEDSAEKLDTKKTNKSDEFVNADKQVVYKGTN